MKKLISLFCVLALIVSVAAFSTVDAGAVEAAKTMVDVSQGDVVTYTLKLGGIELPVIGCDFSMYYDGTLFEVVSVADFNDKTSEDDWTPLINTGLDGEIRGNWSILKGVDFSTERNFMTVKLKAKRNGSCSLSYFVRYMYDDNVFNSNEKPQITDYKFTCDLLVNDKPVLEDAPPQLNVEESQSNGLFVNSVTGDSKDADPDLPGTVVKKSAGSNNAPKSQGNAGDYDVNNNNGGGNSGSVDNPAIGYGSGANSNAGGSGSGNGSDAKAGDAEAVAPPATTAEGYFIIATDAEGNVTATSDEAPAIATADSKGKGGKHIFLWILLGIVVLGGGGAAAYFFLKKKPGKSPNPDEAAKTPTEAVTELADSADDKSAESAENATEALEEGSEKTTLLNTGEEKTTLLETGEEKTTVLDESEK